MQINEAVPHMDGASISQTQQPFAIIPNMPDALHAADQQASSSEGNTTIRSRQGGIPVTSVGLLSSQSSHVVVGKSQWLRYYDAMPAPELLPIAPALRASTMGGIDAQSVNSSLRLAVETAGQDCEAGADVGWRAGARDSQIDLKVCMRR